MIQIHNLRSAGFVNDTTAMDGDVASVCGDVVTLIGVATISRSGRHPVLSFSEEAAVRFGAQDEHTADDVQKAMLAALEKR